MLHVLQHLNKKMFSRKPRNDLEACLLFVLLFFTHPGIPYGRAADGILKIMDPCRSYLFARNLRGIFELLSRLANLVYNFVTHREVITTAGVSSLQVCNFSSFSSGFMA